MKREIIDLFEGKQNVTHVIYDNGAESYLTQSRSFAEEAYNLGATKLNTVENEKKHVLFLFNSKDEEVGRYYLGKSLQGMTPEQLVELKECIIFLESWNPDTKTWVPCVGFKKTNQFVQSPIADRCNPAAPSSLDKKEVPQMNSLEKDPKFEYTEEMFKQEIADQEEKDLLEYGTTDEKKIAQIKKDKKVNRNFGIFIIIVGIVVCMFMGLIQKCTGSKYNPLEDNTPWEPRHTQLYNTPNDLCDYTICV